MAWIGYTFEQLAKSPSERNIDYEARKIAKDEVGGFEISTVFAEDVDQFETAIIDANGTHPVERYDEREQAIAGHAKWMTNAPTLTEVLKLGDGDEGLVPDVMITLRRK